jgi:acyl-CoA synthetase (AMP-forming)/AMP-acid ligase II
MKAGAAFVPLSANDPPARTALLLMDSGAEHVITVERLKDRFAQWIREDRQLLCIDHDSGKVEQQSCENIEIETKAEGVACLLYRSAISGRPEGIVLQHRSLTARSFGQELALRESDRVAQDLNFFHDTTCLEAFTALAFGACIVDLADRSPLSPRKLASLLRDHAATVLWTSAVLLERLAREFPRTLNNVRLIFCDDSLSVLQRLNETLPHELLNRVYGTYGDGETGGYCIAYPVEGISAQGSIVNGRYLAAGTKFYLLDQQLQPVPEGIPGEICISGDRVALEYLQQPKRSAQVFPDNPFSPDTGRRLYRTGAWARLLPDGKLQLRGRRDRRTVINGFRVECGEIEALLRNYPGVQEAVVRINKDDSSDEKLLAYWIPKKQREQAVEASSPSEPKTVSSELQAYLISILPEYMVPTALLELESLPVKATGKLDYAALPLPGRTGTGVAANFVAPRNDTEQMIAAIWCELLSIKEVGIYNNFFDMGGHSFLITRLQSRLSTTFGRNLSLVELFQYPTISALSQVLSKEAVTSGQQEELDLSVAQNRAELRSELRQRRQRLAVRGAED